MRSKEVDRMLRIENMAEVVALDQLLSSMYPNKCKRVEEDLDVRCVSP